MSFEKFEKVGGWTLTSSSLVGGPRHRVWSSEHGGVELSGVARSLVCVGGKLDGGLTSYRMVGMASEQWRLSLGGEEAT